MLKVGDRVTFNAYRLGVEPHYDGVYGTITYVCEDPCGTVYTIDWGSNKGIVPCKNWTERNIKLAPLVKTFAVCNTKLVGVPTLFPTLFKDYFGEGFQNSGYESAVNEARRSAQKWPGQDFLVCEVVARVRAEVATAVVTEIK